MRRLDQACKSQNVKGYLGLLADHLEISDTRFSSVVDIAAKSKLFSLFVETVDQAETICCEHLPDRDTKHGAEKTSNDVPTGCEADLGLHPSERHTVRIACTQYLLQGSHGA